MREQHGPGIADPVVEVNTPLGRIGFKIRGDVIDLQCHDPPLASQRAKVPSAKPDIWPPRAAALSENCKKEPCRCYKVWVGPGRGFQMGSTRQGIPDAVRFARSPRLATPGVAQGP